MISKTQSGMYLAVPVKFFVHHELCVNHAHSLALATNRGSAPKLNRFRIISLDLD